eukprot:5995108-Alexandrium_andersonii.AAC.1
MKVIFSAHMHHPPTPPHTPTLGRARAANRRKRCSPSVAGPLGPREEGGPLIQAASGTSWQLKRNTVTRRESLDAARKCPD